MRNWNLDLSLRLLVVAALAIVPATAQAQQRGYASTTVALTVQVPSVVRVVLDETTANPDGSPIFRIVTNDPAIRALVANGVPAELVQRAADPETVVGHAKGAEQVPAVEAAGRVVRYTVVAP